MQTSCRFRRPLLCSLLALALGLATPAAAPAAVKFTRVASIPGTGGPVYVHGVAKIPLSGAGGRPKLNVTAPTYQVFSESVKL